VTRFIPIAVTAGRGLCGPVVAACLLAGHSRAAFWIFVFAALTDLIDGWLARVLGSDRVLGAMLDPLADKLLGATGWIGLLWVGWAPLWLAGPLLVRDAVVAWLWRHYRGQGVLWQANPIGQIATSYEGTAIAVLLFHGPWLGIHWPSVGVGIGLHGLLLSAVSAIQYGIEGPPPAVLPTEQSAPGEPLAAPSLAR